MHDSQLTVSPAILNIKCINWEIPNIAYSISCRIVMQFQNGKCEGMPLFQHRKQNKFSELIPKSQCWCCNHTKKLLTYGDKSGLTRVLTRHILFSVWERECLCWNAVVSWQVNVTAYSHWGKPALKQLKVPWRTETKNDLPILLIQSQGWSEQWRWHNSF